PFLYFTSHSDPGLVQAVREGRRREFAGFVWSQEVPDPQDPQTFRWSVLDHHLREPEPHRSLLRFYHGVISLRERSPALRNCSKEHVEVTRLAEQPVLFIRRWQPQEDEVLLFVSFAPTPVSMVPPLPSGQWQQMLDSGAECYGGPARGGLPTVLRPDEQRRVVLAPFTFALYHNAPE